MGVDMPGRNFDLNMVGRTSTQPYTSMILRITLTTLL